MTEERYAPTASSATIDSSVVTSTTRSASGQLRGSTSSTRPTLREAAATPSRLLVTGAPLLSGRAPGAVADTAHGHHDRRVLRIVLDLGAQPLDVDVHQARVRAVAVPPHVAQQHVAGEDLPRLARQLREQVELERGEGDQLIAAAHLVPVDVDGQVTDRQLLRGRLLRPAHPRLDPGHELLG